jgi:hypothetical protein
MKESFLHYVWKTLHFDKFQLKTESNLSVEIIKPGWHNQHAGPDFSNARLRIENTLWVGQVEIHIKSSDWHAHNHHRDKAYDGVILHVVYENDADVYRMDGSKIPCIELRNRIHPNLIEQYQHLQLSQDKIPCGHQFGSINAEAQNMAVEAMAIRRLERKILRFKDRLEQQRMDWESIFYEELCYCFGLHQNALPFSLVAKNLPLRIIQKHIDNPLQVEALLFGVSGLLSAKPRDFYESCLLEEFRFLRHKYALQAIDISLWKMLRMRPANFPTVRLAQLCQLLCTQTPVFARLKDNLNLESVKNLIKCSTSGYWNTHYTFGKTSKTSVKKLGNGTIDRIVINAVVPVFYHYAQQTNNLQLQEQAICLLEDISPEDNRTIRAFQSIGCKADNALQTQGLLELHQKFCTFKKCLECSIGHHILKRNTEHETEVY